MSDGMYTSQRLRNDFNIAGANIFMRV